MDRCGGTRPGLEQRFPVIRHVLEDCPTIPSVNQSGTALSNLRVSNTANSTNAISSVTPKMMSSILALPLGVGAAGADGALTVGIEGALTDGTVGALTDGMVGGLTAGTEGGLIVGTAGAFTEGMGAPLGTAAGGASGGDAGGVLLVPPMILVYGLIPSCCPSGCGADAGVARASGFSVRPWNPGRSKSGAGPCGGAAGYGLWGGVECSAKPPKGKLGSGNAADLVSGSGAGDDARWIGGDEKIPENSVGFLTSGRTTSGLEEAHGREEFWGGPKSTGTG
jgi:hypothetical protein